MCGLSSDKVEMLNYLVRQRGGRAGRTQILGKMQNLFSLSAALPSCKCAPRPGLAIRLFSKHIYKDAGGILVSLKQVLIFPNFSKK